MPYFTKEQTITPPRSKFTVTVNRWVYSLTFLFPVSSAAPSTPFPHLILILCTRIPPATVLGSGLRRAHPLFIARPWLPHAPHALPLANSLTVWLRSHSSPALTQRVCPASSVLTSSERSVQLLPQDCWLPGFRSQERAWLCAARPPGRGSLPRTRHNAQPAPGSQLSSVQIAQIINEGLELLLLFINVCQFFYKNVQFLLFEDMCLCTQCMSIWYMY